MEERLSPEERILRKGPAEGKLAQAYIIRAASAFTAENAARAFCRRLLCSSHTGCGKCSGCRKFDNGNHMDAFIVDTNKQIIKKENIDGLADFIADRPYEGGYKVVFVPDADRMTVNIQNRLLKSVEEPPENVIFVFSTANLYGILRTIRSRSVDIFIHPKPISAVKEAIQPKAGKLSQVYAAYSGGSVDEAERLIKSESFLTDREEAMSVIEQLSFTEKPTVSFISSKLLDNISDRCMYAASMLEDCIMISFGIDRQRLANDDMYDRLCAVSEKLTAAKMSKMTDVFLESAEKKKIIPAINTKMAADNTIIKLMEVLADVRDNRRAF